MPWLDLVNRIHHPDRKLGNPTDGSSIGIPLHLYFGTEGKHRHLCKFQSQSSIDCRLIPSLARRVSSEFVLMRHPFITGIAQAATGFGLFSTSTKHIRQLPATAKRS